MGPAQDADAMPAQDAVAAVAAEGAVAAGDLTDRLLVTWRLDAPHVVGCCRRETREPESKRSGPPAPRLAWTSPTDAPVPVPRPDRPCWSASRPTSGGCGPRTRRSPLEWRRALRDLLGGLMADGFRVRSFVRDGWYVLDDGNPP